MHSPKGDPTYIKNKDRYFLEIAKVVGQASTHPKSPGGCVVVRDRELVGEGRSLLTDSGSEVDCVAYAIAAAAKNGTPMMGAVIYTTRYPFTQSIFQAHVMGIKKIMILAHEWEPYYASEFRKAARLARELGISIEPLFDDEDQRFTVNTYDRDINQEQFTDANPFAPDEYDNDPKESATDDNSTPF